MKFGDNKKGQGMPLNTIILIVLGIVVLVFLIFGFSTGWGNFWDRVTNLGGGSTNLDVIEKGCELACLQNSKADWCTTSRTLRYLDESGKKQETKGNCSSFSTSKTGGVSVSCGSITC